MVRTGAQYREGLRDGREVWIDGERVKDIRVHPAVMPIVDMRARIYEVQREPDDSSVLTCFAENERHALFNRLPMEANGPSRGSAQVAGVRARPLELELCLTFVQFAQAPHFNHLAAAYGAFDFSGPLDIVCNAAGLSDKVERSP
jgi:4-hydroxyphenylacetate 3-hydroxylase N terminal